MSGEAKQVQREQIIDQVLSATTLSECETAKGLIIAWMQENPRDFGMLDAGEQVEMILDGYRHESLAAPMAA